MLYQTSQKFANMFLLGGLIALMMLGWRNLVVSVMAAPLLERAYDRVYDLGTNVEFEHISVEQGLSQSSVFCILQDHEGFMWFGTAGGLNKYDGYGFTVYKHDPHDVQSLSDNTVWSMVEDSSGMLWVGTENGLNMFDRERERFIRYRNDVSDPHSLSNDVVLALYEDHQGTLWIGTRGGLNKFERSTGRFIHYRNNPSDAYSLSHDTVWTIHEDHVGMLWVGTSVGLNMFDRETGRFVRYEHDSQDPHSLSHNLVQTIYEDQAGGLWIGTGRGGLNRFNRGAQGFDQYLIDPHGYDVDDFTYNDIKAVYEDQEGVLWIGTDGGGLYIFDRVTKRFVHYQTDPDSSYSLSNNYVNAIYEDRTGVLWVGTWGGGINKYDRMRARFVHHQADPNDANSLSHNGVLALYEDRSGILWVGTDGGGLDSFYRQSESQRGWFDHYKHDPDNPYSLSSNYVVSLYEDRMGALWVGTHGEGLDQLDRSTGRFVHYQAAANSLSHNVIESIYEDRAGVLWVGTGGGGLNKLLSANLVTDGSAQGAESLEFVHYRTSINNLASATGAKSVYVDASGVLWIGNHGGGLNRLLISDIGEFRQDNDIFVHYQTSFKDPQGLGRDIIWTIYEDRTGELWLGTHGRGLGKFDRESETFTYHLRDRDNPRSLSHNVIFSIYEDSSGMLWIGTGGGGLNRFDRDREMFIHYTAQDGLSDNVVYCILGDDQGDLWLSTNKGLSRFDPQAETFRNYGTRDGLQGYEFSRACYKSRWGEMFFGGMNGFNAFYPSEVQDNLYVPPVVLTSLTQGGEAVDLDRALEKVTHVTFSWPKNFFEFEFAALSYVQPEKNRYAYKLEGFDEEWNYIGTRRFGRYTNLEGGTYTLRLRASNNDGVWNETGAALEVTIVPPLWKAWWFRGGVILLLAVVLVAGYQVRVRRIAARTHELESQVEERTFEIERRRQELEALYHADEELYQHLRLDQVLRALVAITVDILGADKSSLMVWDEQQEHFMVQVTHGFEAQSLDQMVFEPDGDVIGRVMSTGEPVVVGDVAKLTQNACVAKRVIEVEGIRSFMYVPVKVQGEIFGLFSVDYVEPHTFSEDEQRLFMALAQRAALVIEKAQLHEQTQALAVMEERNRLARDLHDAVTQTLFSASLIAEVLPNLWDQDQDEGRQLLKELRQLSRGALAEMRTLLLELRPAALMDANLDDLLRQLADAVVGRTGLPVQLRVEGAGSLPPQVHVALYRIAQEALNNVVKHARANHVSVTMRRMLDEAEGNGATQCVELSVMDDGLGFEPECVPSDRLGLCIIRERAQAIGAALNIDSKLGSGTRVTVVWCPYEDNGDMFA